MTFPEARIPAVEVYVGPPDIIFGRTNGGFLFDDKFNDIFDTVRQNGYEAFQEGGCVTLKPRNLVENMRLAGRRRGHLDPYAQAFHDTHYGGYNSTDDPEGAWLTTDWITATGSDADGTATPEERWRRSLSHQWAVRTSFSAYIVTSDSRCVRVKAKATPSRWMEAVPHLYPACIRLAQTQPLTASGGWIVTRLETDRETLPENPSVTFQFDKRSPNREQRQSQQMRGTYIDAAGETVDATLTFNTPTLAVEMASGSDDALAFVFQNGEPPKVIRLSDGLVWEGGLNETVTLQDDQPMTLTLRWVPPGYYVMTGSMLSTPMIVSFQTAEQKEAWVTVPPGPLSVTFLGWGVFSFACAPLRYVAAASLQTQPIHRGFKDDLSSGIVVKDDRYLSKVPEGELHPIVHTSWVVVDQDATWPLGTKRRVQPRIGKNRMQEEDFAVRIETTSRDTTETPYIYRSSVEYVPKPPEMLNLLDEYRIGNPTGHYPDTAIRSFNVQPQAVNFYRVKLSGDLTLTNYRKEWNNTLAHPVPVQHAVKIYFKWVNAPDARVSTVNGSILATGPGGAAIFTPGDPEDEKHCVFTGYMTATNLARQVGNRWEAQFRLADLWQRMADTKIENSKYYDGTGWMSSVRDILKMGGVRSQDIVTDDPDFGLQDTVFDRMVLPLGPASLERPQYRFQYGTNCEAAFDKLHGLARVFVFTRGDGKLEFRVPKKVLLAQTPTRFYDRIAPAYATEGEAGDAPWRSLSPFSHSRSAETVINMCKVLGPNMDVREGKTYFAAMPAIVSAEYDLPSITDPAAENYISYMKILVYGQAFLLTDKDRNLMCRRLLKSARMPVETVSWSSDLNSTVGLYTPVVFTDSAGIISDTETYQGETAPKVFWITGNALSYQAGKTLTAKSQFTAARLRGLLGDIQ